MPSQEPVETQVAVLINEFKNFAIEFARHTSQDMAQFTKIDEKLDGMTDKLNELLIREAIRMGELKSHQKSSDKRSGIISTAVAGIVSLLVSYALIKMGVNV